MPKILIQLRRIGGLACGLGLAACASTGGGFDRLSAVEQAPFARCREPVAEYVCADKDGDALAACIQVQEAAFSGRRTDRMRRSWLVQNGCPAALVDAPLVVAQVPAEPSPPPPVSEPALAKEGDQPQEQLLTEKTGAPIAEQGRLLPAAAVCARSAECESDLCVQGQCMDPSELASLMGASTPRRPTVARHQADVQQCVDRQLKDVDAQGRLTAASLQRADLTETSLESCLRQQASFWRFSRTARGYTGP